MKVLCNS